MCIESITISFLGVSERSKSTFQVFFKSMGQAKFELINDYRKAQLCLVDKDSYDIQSQYESLIQDFPDIHVLALSIVERPSVHKKEFFLKKPVAPDGLVKSLDKIYRLISDSKKSDIQVANENVDRSSSASPLYSGEHQAIAKIKSNLVAKTRNDSISSVKNVIDNIDVAIKKTHGVSTKNAGNLLNVQVEYEKYFIGRQHEKHLVGQQNDIDVDDPEQLKSIFYESSRSLQLFMEQACVRARQSNNIIQLDVLEYTFYFDAEKQNVYSATGLTKIRSLCVIEYNDQVSLGVKDNIFRNELYDCFRSKKDEKASELLVTQCWTTDYFMWLVSLWCSRGRLPNGTDLFHPICLKQWPNLTRLEPIPNAARIAALIYKRPHTLTNITKQLELEQRYVFAFFSACKSIGLLNDSSQDVDAEAVIEKSGVHTSKSIMSKLLKKLVSFSVKNTDKMNYK